MADESAGDQPPPWRTLVKSKDTSKLFQPLGTSAKIKYTCLAVSSRYVVLGANTGGVYCFSARDFKYLRLLTNKEGGASLARFSPDEEILAVAVSGGRVCFWELNLDEEHGVSKRFHVSTVLQEAVVSDMVWDWRGTRLFFADHLGRVAVAYLPKLSRLKFGTNSLFKKVDEVIHTEKAKIIQLDFWQSALLVSTTQRCCLIKLQWDSIDAVVQVGRKLRDGPFGACVLNRGPQSYPKIYSARPGGRLWAADVEGTVLSTLKSKELIADPPINILGLSNTSTSAPPLSVNFSRLIIYNGAHIVTWQDHALFLFNPFSDSLTCWTHNLRSIVDVQSTPPTQGCVARDLFVLHEECRKITCLTVCTVEETLSLAIKQDRLEIATKLLDLHPDVVDSAMATSDRVRQLVSTVRHTLVNSPPPDDVMIEETDLGEERPPSDEDTDKDQEGMPELKREEIIEDLLAELDPESVGEGEEVTQPHQPSEAMTIMHVEEEDKLTTGAMATSLPREIPVLPPTPTQQEKPSSLTQQPDRASSLPVVTTSSLPTTTEAAAPSILARMESSGAEKEHVDDMLVVRTKVNRKKQSKKSKKRRGSLPPDFGSGRPLKTSSELDVALLADITEHTPSPFTPSPSHSALSSSIASGESSPLSSSPKADGSSGDKTPPNCGDPDDDPQQRSLSESVEGQARFGSAAALLSRVKSMASQHGQGDAIQRPVKMMRDLISSLTPPTPLAGQLQGTGGAGLVYTNYDSGHGLGEEGAGLASPPSTSEGSPCLALSPPPPAPSPPSVVVSPSPPPSPVDPHTRDFIISVTNTRSDLNNSTTISGVESLQYCLSQWMGHLDSYRRHMSSTEGPFHLPQLSAISESVREEVIELVTLCLEVLVMEEERVMEYVSHYALLLDIPRAVGVIANMSKLSIMAACWRILATASEESLSSSQCEIIESRQLLQSRPQFAPAMMCRTYDSDRDTFVSLCAQSPMHVAPWEVGVVCCIDQLASSGCNCHSITRYLDHVMVGGARPHPVHREGLLQQPEVLLGALEAVLTEGAELDMSHDKRTHSQPHHSTLQSLIKLCIDGKLSEQALSLCHQYSYWEGYIDMCSVTGRRRDGLKAALSLGDISVMRELVKNGKLLNSAKDWQCLLQDLVKNDSSIPTVATSDSRLSWEELVVLMVECLGVDETGRIMLECEGVCDGREKVMVKVHTMIVELSSLQRQQRAVVHALLEKLDQYLWSQRPPALGPELMGVYRSEGVDLSPPTSCPSSTVFIEDSASHWGTTVGNMRCGVCQCDMGVVHCNGVMVFRCGHGYHKNCLPEQACVLCFMKTNSLTLSFKTQASKI